MGNCLSKNDHRKTQETHSSQVQQNIHTVIPDIKVHTVVTGELDFDHESAMKIPLGEVTDEQLLAEVARRKLDLHDRITDVLVKETYDFGKVLGHGASGQVILVTHKANGKSFACKIVKKDKNMNDAQSMSTELEIMKRIRHRHVVSMYELYETPSCLWMVLELVSGGDLYHHLAFLETFNEAAAARYMKQILMGIHYLHSLGVVHRDLKLENILLSDSTTCDIKIADFGLSALVRLGDRYDAEESNKRKQFKDLKEMWGTKEYFAPELIGQAYGPQADVWAVGCVLYEMLCGLQAFGIREHDTEETFYGRILKGDFDVTTVSAFSHVSTEAKELLTQMLKVDPTKRLSASEALLHPWITGKCHTDLRSKELNESQRVLKHRIELKEKREKRRASATTQQSSGH